MKNFYGFISSKWCILRDLVKNNINKKLRDSTKRTR